MEKRNVYVKVNSIEQCEELYELLKSKGEKIYYLTEEGLKTGVDSDGDSQLSYPYIYEIYDGWTGHPIKPSIREVSIQQLSEIL